MAIDFHASSNQYTYAKRVAHAGWGDFICQRVDPAGKAVADIGCGGGIYSAAWAGLGARRSPASIFPRRCCTMRGKPCRD